MLLYEAQRQSNCGVACQETMRNIYYIASDGTITQWNKKDKKSIYLKDVTLSFLNENKWESVN